MLSDQELQKILDGTETAEEKVDAWWKIYEEAGENDEDHLICKSDQ